MKLYFLLFFIWIIVKKIWGRSIITLDTKNTATKHSIREYDSTNGECKFVNSLLGRDLFEDCCDEVTCKEGHITKM